VSPTLFLGEKPIERGDLGWMSGTRATLRNTGTLGWTTAGGRPNYARETIADTIRNGDRDSGAGDFGSEDYGSEYGSAMGGGGDGMGGPVDPAVTAPKAPAEPQPPAQPGPTLPVGGFDGEHPGGSMFAFGDGGVRFISDTIAPGTFQQLGNRSDGKLLDKGDF